MFSIIIDNIQYLYKIYVNCFLLPFSSVLDTLAHMLGRNSSPSLS